MVACSQHNSGRCGSYGFFYKVVRDFDYSFIFIYPAANGMEEINGIIIFHINTAFFKYFKAGIVDIGDLVVGQYLEIDTFNLNFTTADGTIHLTFSFHKGKGFRCVLAQLNAYLTRAVT